MIIKIKNDLNKRKERMYEFYYKGIGDKIKKRRLELNMTQAKLAKGICSNTYISKIENQKTIAKSAPLNLIMEKMEMKGEKVAVPEKLIYSLEKSVDYFYYNDIEKYKLLIDELADYEFGVLLNITRLGYYVLTENFEKASPIYNEMFRYLNTLEEFGLSVFLIYAGYFSVSVNDYTNARMIIELTKNRIQNDDRVIALYSQLCYEVYGELQISVLSPMSIDYARTIYISRYNPTRIEQIAVLEDLYRKYKNDNEHRISEEHLSRLSKNQRNKYLFGLLHTADNPIDVVDMMDENGVYYMEGLFMKAKYYLENEEKRSFKAVMDKMNELHYKLDSKVDYVDILKHYESKESLYIKDKLISYVLPHAVRMQSIQWINSICDEIVDILEEKNRYKDSLIYKTKKETLVNELQTYQE